MTWLSKLFGFGCDEPRTTISGPHGTREVSQAELDRAYDQMRRSMANETPEQKARFYLEVAAQLGNESAAKRLAEMGPDPEKTKPN